MKKHDAADTGYRQSASQPEDGAANGALPDKDLEGLSAVAYERRRKLWTRFNYGDWWIAVGVYLIFCSMAFVIL